MTTWLELGAAVCLVPGVMLVVAGIAALFDRDLAALMAAWAGGSFLIGLLIVGTALLVALLAVG